MALETRLNNFELTEEESSLRKRLRDIIHSYSTTVEDFDFLTKIAIDFKRSHPDSYDYVLYHDLIGSTPPPFVTKFDMPNHEIENLINELPNSFKISKAA